MNDEDLKVVHFEDLRYPPLGRLERIQGVVVVRVKLDEKGNVVEPEAISGAKLLIPESLANAKKWSFQPNSEKAAVIVYNFRLTSGYCHTITSHSRFCGQILQRLRVVRSPSSPNNSGTTTDNIDVTISGVPATGRVRQPGVPAFERISANQSEILKVHRRIE